MSLRPVDQPDFERRAASTRLVVLLHAYSNGPASLAPIRAVVAKVCPDADIWCPNLDTGIWSSRTPNEIAVTVLRGIDERWNERAAMGRQYERIIFVGHSLGALIARKVYVCASSSNNDAPFEDGLETEGRPWASAVTRLILLAAMNRGWSPSHHLSRRHAILWRSGLVIAAIYRRLGGSRLLIEQMRRGSPFITQLRIQWLSMLRHAPSKGVGHALVVQLLGTIDDFVGPDDNVDLVTGRNFVYRDVPGSGHGSVIELDDPEHGAARRELVVEALTQSDEELRQRSVPPADLLPQAPRPEVTDVIFVIHGIRDTGYWTQRVARRVKEAGRRYKCEFETETSAYGYFPMLPFLFRKGRQAKVEWLMDQYTEDLALYPRADFSFVGHSNGTYLLAKALEQNPACRFKHVVFAGSVVNIRYDWRRLIREKRVRAILNYVATSDLVVAIFPKTFQMLRLQDLGSAGHDGFTFIRRSAVESITSQQQSEEGEFQAKYVKGRHSAALDERLWDGIAHFIVHGEPLEIPEALYRKKQPLIVRALGWAAPVCFGLLLAAAVGIGLAIWQSGWAEMTRAFALMGYVALLWSVLTRL